MSTQLRPRIGNRVEFDGKRTSWLARAGTDDGRYLLLTCAIFGAVYYTIIDFDEQVRGAMNVIGGGLDIFTISGADPAIDEAIDMLRSGDWEVSHRNRVPLRITALARWLDMLGLPPCERALRSGPR